MHINPFESPLTAREAKEVAMERGEDLTLYYTRQQREQDICSIRPGGPRYHEEWRQLATRIEIVDHKGRVIQVNKDRDGPTGPVEVERTWDELIVQWFKSRHPWRLAMYYTILFLLFVPLYRTMQRVDADLAWYFWWGFILWLAAPDKRGPEKWRP